MSLTGECTKDLATSIMRSMKAPINYTLESKESGYAGKIILIPVFIMIMPMDAIRECM